MKKCGILMPVFSLPNDYGIGSFGKKAYRFVDFLVETKQDYWQVLPLCQTSYGDSPYQSPSAFAGNPYFIDLDLLYEDGLITEEERQAQRINCTVIDYEWLYDNRYGVLRKAFVRFKTDNAYKEFVVDNSEWLLPYARFMSNKTKNGGKPWNEWTQFVSDSEEEQFWIFIQYEFFLQWCKLKEYANKNGIEIIGDIPIYVAYDSADVWDNTQYFQLDSEFNPKTVAGVPPDEYCEDGQLWGNPLYNWELIRKENFVWWLKRFEAALKLYDIVRIDHFRGFAGYYSIPYGEDTARNGKWIEAPGEELFNVLKKYIPDAKIIAEDLGFLDDSVVSLLIKTGFPGMKIAQFGFYEKNSIYNPKNYVHNCVAYTGTHDNTTTCDWLNGLSKEEKTFFRKSVGKTGSECDIDALIRCLFQSKADTVIIPIQDYLHLGEEGRINTPSTLGCNWRWRLCANYFEFGEKVKSFNKFK